MHEAGDELSPRQQVQLEVLVEAFHDKHGEDADPREILLAKSIRLEWIAFTILYPKMSFLLVKVVDVIRGVNAIFMDEFMLKDEEIYNPVNYVLLFNHLDVWKDECSMIFGMGPGSFLWNNKIWEIDDQIKRTQDGHLMAELEADTASLHEPLRSQMKEAIDAIKPRFVYLDRCKVTIKRLKDASQLAQRAIRQPLEAPDSSEIHELPEHGEQSVVVRNNNTASATDDHPEEADAPVEASSTAIDVYPSNRQSRKRRGKSQLVYPHRQPSHEVVDRSLPFAKDLRKPRAFDLIVSFLGHRTTILFLTPLIIGISAVLLGTSITQASDSSTSTTSNERFYSTLSQMILSLLSLFCIVLPLLRSRDIPLNLFWFRICLLSSFLSGIISVVILSFQWQISGILTFISSVSQVVATLQVIEGVDGAIR